MPVFYGGKVDGQFFGIAVSWHYGSEIGGTGGDVLHGWVLWVDPWNSVTGLLPVARARASRCLCLSAHERWDEQVDCHGLHAGDRCQ